MINKKNRALQITLNLGLLLLFFSIYLMLEVPRPYGIVASGISTITFLFNFIEKKALWIPLYIAG